MTDVIKDKGTWDYYWRKSWGNYKPKIKTINMAWGFFYDDKKIVHFKGFKYNKEDGIYVNKKGESFMRAGKRKLVRLKNEGDGW